MARSSRSTTNDQGPTHLRVPLEDARARLEDRIQKGHALQRREVPNPDELERAKKDFYIWTEYNEELLRTLFTNDRLATEYHGVSIGGGIDLPFDEALDAFREDVDYYTRRLESVRERLPLLVPPNVAPNRAILAHSSTTPKATQPPETIAPSPVRIFVGHSSNDAELTSRLCKLFRSALNLPALAIRATSVDGHRLPGGADTDEQLRREIVGADAFVGILSAVSADSAYVLMELGARWGAKKQLIPLIAPGSSSDVLRGPIAGKNALRIDSRAELHQLVRELAETLKVQLQPAEAYSAEIEAVLALKPPVPAPTTRAQKQKRAKPKRTARPAREVSDEALNLLRLLAHARERQVAPEPVSLAKAIGHSTASRTQYFLDELKNADLIASARHSRGYIQYSLTALGREYLFKRNLL